MFTLTGQTIVADLAIAKIKRRRGTNLAVFLPKKIKQFDQLRIAKIKISSILKTFHRGPFAIPKIPVIFETMPVSLIFQKC